MTDDKKNEQPRKPEQDKIDELPPKPISDSDAQSVKGGRAATQKVGL